MPRSGGCHRMGSEDQFKGAALYHWLMKYMSLLFRLIGRSVVRRGGSGCGVLVT